MKKKIVKLLFIVSVMISSFFYLSEQRESVETLLFNNIEALASGEGDGSMYNCYGWGEIDCYGNKVEFMIDGMDLD